MDNCLQEVLPKIAKELDKEYIEGECAITRRNELYLTERAEEYFKYTDFCTSICNLNQLVQYSNIPKQYIQSIEILLKMVYDNYEHFKFEEYSNVYILFGFYCPLHLQNSNNKRKNLIIYLLIDPPTGMWGSICKLSGINSIVKYMGYNNYLPCDQY